MNAARGERVETKIHDPFTSLVPVGLQKGLLRVAGEGDASGAWDSLAAFAEAGALLAAVSFAGAWHRNLFHSKTGLNGTADIDATCRSRTRQLSASRNTRPHGKVPIEIIGAGVGTHLRHLGIGVGDMQTEARAIRHAMMTRRAT